MSKRSISILGAFAAAIIAMVFYVGERDSHISAKRTASPKLAVVNSIRKVMKKTAAGRVMAPTKSGTQEQYSAKEYSFLRQHYRSAYPLAYGPLSSSSLKEVAKYIRENTQDKKMLPAINDVIYGKASALEDKLDTGLSPNATFFMLFPTNLNESLLDVAVETGQRSIIKVLLEHGATVNPFTVAATPDTNSEVELPLQIAAQYGEDDVIRLLLRRGANVNQIMAGAPTGTTLLTPLADAANAGNVSTVYLLLTHGADINSALDPGGTVPSFFLLPDNSPSIVAIRKLLIRYGARMPSGQ